ncbi:hypothetical protein PRZ48_011341 [Zasmidium cellare]|uniref:Uncharacterized protein n=1 Tax=Zasmidium cellare TaxID=395010 RepID=A0ABR0E628_ZASCE|nr:hypothetical protein PRZ48_011341 [Zasmidium cellare]
MAEMDTAEAYEGPTAFESELISIGNLLQSTNVEQGGLAIMINRISSAYKELARIHDAAMEEIHNGNVQLQAEKERLEQKQAGLDEWEKRLESRQRVIESVNKNATPAGQMSNVVQAMDNFDIQEPDRTVDRTRAKRPRLNASQSPSKPRLGTANDRSTRSKPADMAVRMPVQVDSPDMTFTPPTKPRKISLKWPTTNDKSLEDVAGELRFLDGSPIPSTMLDVLEQGLSLFRSTANFASLKMNAQSYPKCASARVGKGDAILESGQKYSCGFCESYGTLCIHVWDGVRTILPRRVAVETGVLSDQKEFWFAREPESV